MGDRARYEHKTVKALRGTDRAVIAKWEKRGWELTDQTPGTMRTDLTFRRAKPRVTRQVLAIGGVAVVALIGVITIGAVTEDEDKGDKSAHPSPSSSSTADTANIADLLAAREQGKLEDYYREHSTDPIEFDAQITGIGPDTFKSAPFINVRAVAAGKLQGPTFRIAFGGLSHIPFPDSLPTGENVRVRASIDHMIDDDLIFLDPAEMYGSFVRSR